MKLIQTIGLYAVATLGCTFVVACYIKLVQYWLSVLG